MAIAFTTLRRLGTFLPATKKDVAQFSWVEDKFIRYFEDTETMLI